MNYVEESLTSRKYLSLAQALDVSGLSLPELRRAMALGVIRGVDVGNTSFVEHFSLKKYIEQKSGEKEHPQTAGTQSTFFPDQDSLDEDTHLNQKEREMFRAALERDSETTSKLATAPYASIALLVLFALTLALPISQTIDSEKLSSAQSFFTHAQLKEVTTDKVETLLVRANTTQQTAIQAVEEKIVSTEKRDYFAGYQEQQGANAFAAWFESISEGIDSLALRVYETIEATRQPSE
ncbi:MAG: hypothetical protein WDZ74_01575 [Candidatus Paceibacterota bacterium]